MKTTIFKPIVLVAAVLIAAASCTELMEPTPQFAGQQGDFSFTPSTTTITVAPADSLVNKLDLSWTDPQFSVGLAQSKFTVIVGPAGQNFVRFSQKEFTGVLAGSLLGKEINGMALQFGATAGQPFNMDLKVIASYVNNSAPVSSAPVQISVTSSSGFALSSSVASFIPSPATPSATGVTFSWNKAFAGFSGVITYQLQHAKGGTSFANPTTINVSGLSRSFTHLDMNNIALGYSITPGTAGNVDFRIKATNELGAIAYSTTSTLSVTPYVAINSVGIIGDATPGLWAVDTDMYRPNPNNPADWQVIVYLIGGKEVLFRENDLWDTKWGVGGQGGNNIPIASTGYYRANLNVATGVYSLTLLTIPAIPNGLSLTGPAVGGWGIDTPLVQDSQNPMVYSGTITVASANAPGSLKFRHTGDWNINWGGAAGDDDPANYPSAWGKNNGGNIRINTAGTYFVSINIATGEYAFGPANRGIPYNDIGIIGNSTTGNDTGWANDINLIKNPSNPYKWSKKLTLFNGEAKFRADNDWGTNWGDAPFPKGIGTQNGSNIGNVAAGTYQITFNTLTGEYSFAN